MRHGSIWLGLALAAGCAAAAAAQGAYPGDRAIARAAQRARGEAAGCERELRDGSAGPACGRYHAAVLLALGLQAKRLAWCNARSSEQSNVEVPPSCFAVPSDLGIEAVEGLERKASPKTWRAFDKRMAELSP